MNIITKQKNNKMYVYDKNTKRGRYYNVVKGALPEYYISLFLSNKDKIRKKSEKYIKEIMDNTKTAKDKQNIRVINLNNLNKKQQNSFNKTRNLIDKTKHGMIEVINKGEIIDDITLNKKLLQQVIIDKRKLGKLMLNRNYIKDLIMIDIELRGDLEETKNIVINNALLGRIKLFNCDFEYLKGVLDGSNLIGLKLYYAEKIQNENKLKALFGTDNIELKNNDMTIRSLKIKGTIGRS